MLSKHCLPFCRGTLLIELCNMLDAYVTVGSKLQKRLTSNFKALKKSHKPNSAILIVSNLFATRLFGESVFTKRLSLGKSLFKRDCWAVIRRVCF